MSARPWAAYEGSQCRPAIAERALERDSEWIDVSPVDCECGEMPALIRLIDQGHGWHYMRCPRCNATIARCESATSAIAEWNRSQGDAEPATVDPLDCLCGAVPYVVVADSLTSVRCLRCGRESGRCETGAEAIEFWNEWTRNG